MGIRAKFTKADIEKMFATRIQRLDQVIINRLILIGEQFVINARNNGSYKDQTGNLRSSIGYIVMKNGERLSESFQAAGNGTDKVTGVATGEEFIETIAGNFAKGYVLIVVAGMNYAAAVESKGRDVLSASASTAKTELKQAINDIKQKVASL